MSSAAQQGATGSAITNLDLVTYALAVLDGAERPVHLERIAVKAFELSPGAFRWDLDEYAGFIDKDKVRVTLTDAQKPKYGGLVRAVGAKRQGISKPTDAWQLTPAGAGWFTSNRDRIAQSLGLVKPSIKRRKADDLRRRLVRSDLYQEFKARRGEITSDPFKFADLLECSPDASNRVVQDKLDALRIQARLLGDQDLVQFLEACASAHADMLLK